MMQARILLGALREYWYKGDAELDPENPISCNICCLIIKLLLNWSQRRESKSFEFGICEQGQPLNVILTCTVQPHGLTDMNTFQIFAGIWRYKERKVLYARHVSNPPLEIWMRGNTLFHGRALHEIRLDETSPVGVIVIAVIEKLKYIPLLLGVFLYTL